jgi:hypothetical protein
MDRKIHIIILYVEGNFRDAPRNLVLQVLGCVPEIPGAQSLQFEAWE